MSRWKYKTDTVTVGDNTQTVRQLTAAERAQFAALSNDIKDHKLDASQLPLKVAKMGCTAPELSETDLADMPTEMLDACVDKILVLSGFNASQTAAAELGDPGEKKAS